MIPRDRPRLTLAEFLTVPVYVAAAMLCIAPATRPGVVRDHGIAQLVLVEAIVAPLAMALVAQVLVRRGRRRERLVAGFLAVSAIAGIVSLVTLVALSLWDIGRAVACGQGLPVDLVAFTITLLGGMIAVGTATRSLLQRVIPSPCPGCGRRALFPDRTAPPPPQQSSADPRYVCEACGLRALRREGGATWLVEDDSGGPAARVSSTVA